MDLLRNETVARPLAEKTDTRGDGDSLPVTWSLDQLGPLPLGIGNLVADTSLDLGKFGLNEDSVLTLTVILDQDFMSFVAAVFRHEPTGECCQYSYPSFGFQQHPYRGDSGTNQIKVSCSNDGAIWTKEGILQAHVSWRLYVPRVVPAAMMAPTYQDSLKRPFRTPASFGYASSAISEDAPEIQKGMPIPRRRRATRNMPTGGFVRSNEKEVGDSYARLTVD